MDLTYLKSIGENLKYSNLSYWTFFSKINYFGKICQTWVIGTILRKKKFGISYHKYHISLQLFHNRYTNQSKIIIINNTNFYIYKQVLMQLMYVTTLVALILSLV